ncbi:hypothetical protein K502DRAFT_362500 [Neoconidiobolus thromboides FSU 785]|nr:hypothetical protein K502DRAFT_362500 [Neoconidiobolus thromboides FSU 785]
MNYKIVLYLQLTYLQLTISQQTSTVIKDLASLTKPIKSTINYLKNWDSILPSFEEYIKKITDITSDFKTKPNTSKESSTTGGDKQNIHELYIGYSYKGPKDRFNYASKDCAANIMSTNPSSRNPSAILDKNKDRYLLDKCSSERYIVVELCQEIEIQTLLLANFEFFSSTFKRFDLYASDAYPPQKEGWYFAGSFEALNIKNFQAFDVNVKGYMKYLKIEFKSHYGNEYYCPISEIKVFGPTMSTILAGFLNNPEEPETQLIKKENFEAVSMEDEGIKDNEEEIEDIKENKEEEIKVIENESKGTEKKSEIFENQQNNISQFIESPHLTTSFNNLPIIPTSSTQCCKKKLVHLFNFEPKISYAVTPYDKYQLKRLFKLEYCKAILSYTDSLKLNHNMVKTKFKKESNTEEEFKTMSSLTTESKFQDILTEMSESEDNIKQPEPTDGENINNNNGNNNSNKNNNNNGPENVFRALNRRLINLESNYQLLQAYIDNQATTFNNLFMEIDQHQLTQFQLGFKELNTLIYLQFQQIKVKQEELWEKMGDQVENIGNKRKLEINILEKKFNVLKNEVKFGKRLQLAQLAVLFIVVLVLLLAKLYNSSINQLDIRNNTNNNTLWWQLTPPNSATGLQFEEEVRNLNFNENELNNINNEEDVNNLIQTLENQEHNNNNENSNENNNNENEFYLNNYPSPETSEISIDRIPTPHPKYLDLQLNSLNNSPINYTINEENEDIDEVDYFDLNKE